MMQQAWQHARLRLSQRPIAPRRDVRVTAAGGPLGVGSRATALAQALLARRGGLLPAPRLRPIFFHGRFLLSPTSTHVSTQVTVNPRLRLTLLVAAAPPAPAAATALPSRPALVWEPLRPSLLHARTERVLQRVQRLERVQERHSEQLVHHLLGRAQAIDAVAPPGAPVFHAGGPTRQNGALTAAVLRTAPAVPPVARIVRRPPPALVTEDVSPRTAVGRAAAAPLAVDGFSVRPSLPAAAPVDINRITDQVVQTLDRRLLAFRERTGRI